MENILYLHNDSKLTMDLSSLRLADDLEQRYQVRSNLKQCIKVKKGNEIKPEPMTTKRRTPSMIGPAE
jgi:hypothetical protein